MRVCLCKCGKCCTGVKWYGVYNDIFYLFIYFTAKFYLLVVLKWLIYSWQLKIKLRTLVEIKAKVGAGWVSEHVGRTAEKHPVIFQRTASHLLRLIPVQFVLFFFFFCISFSGCTKAKTFFFLHAENKWESNSQFQDLLKLIFWDYYYGWILDF